MRLKVQMVAIRRFSAGQHRRPKCYLSGDRDGHASSSCDCYILCCTGTISRMLPSTFGAVNGAQWGQWLGFDGLQNMWWLGGSPLILVL